MALLLCLVVAWLVWVALTGFRADRMPSPTSPYVVAPLALLAGLGVGRVLARSARSTGLHRVLLGTGLLLAVGVLLTAEPGKAPLGYANANAALAVQVIALAGLALTATPRGRRWLPALAIAVGLVAIALNRSAAALFVAVPLVAAIAVATARSPRRRGGVLVVAGAVVATAATVIVSLAGRATWPAWAERGFDPVRRQLWHDASALWATRPLTGRGPGSFAEATALSVDPDTSSAHSLVLQVGSETGWVGVTLVGLVAVTALLIAARGSAAATLVGAAAWAALLVHAQVDHLMEFTPVVLAAGAVLGWAGSTRRSEELDVAEGEGPPRG